MFCRPVPEGQRGNVSVLPLRRKAITGLPTPLPAPRPAPGRLTTVIVVIYVFVIVVTALGGSVVTAIANFRPSGRLRQGTGGYRVLLECGSRGPEPAPAATPACHPRCGRPVRGRLPWGCARPTGEESDTTLGALVPDTTDPAKIGGPEPRPGFAARNDPVNASQIQRRQGAQQRLQRQEPHSRRNCAQILCTVGKCGVLDRNPHPHVRRPWQLRRSAQPTDVAPPAEGSAYETATELVAALSEQDATIGGTSSNECWKVTSWTCNSSPASQ